MSRRTNFKAVALTGSLAFFLVVPVVLAASQSSPTARTPGWPPATEVLRSEMQQALDRVCKEHSLPGATAAAALPDGTVIAVSAGFADLEAHLAMKPSDRMLAGSIGKTYFAAVMMNLIHEHRLSLDEKISTWIGSEPWFNRIPNARDITLHMLMNHTSGIPEHAEAPEFTRALLKDPDRIWSPVELLSFTFDKAPLFPAGKGWSYADTNFILAAYIAEKVSGQKMYDLIQREILTPFDLHDTSPSTSRVLAGLVPGYSMPDSPFGFGGRNIHDGKFVMNPQFEWAGGGFISTSADLARWAKLLYEGKAFPAEMLPTVEDGVPADTGPGEKYGLAVQIRQTPFGVSYGHGGWFPGYLSEMEYFPKYHAALAIQFNTDDLGKIKMREHDGIIALGRAIFPEEAMSGSQTAPPSTQK